MAAPFAAFELVRHLCGNVEAEVIQQTRAAAQRVVGGRAARGLDLSNATVSAVADAMKELIEEREREVLGEMKRALKTKPPEETGPETIASIVNFISNDVGVYYKHGSAEVTRVTKSVGYLDGLPANLNDFYSKLQHRLTAEVQIILAEVSMEPNGKKLQPVV